MLSFSLNLLLHNSDCVFCIPVLQHLATLLITMQLVQQFQESLLPYLWYKWYKASIVKKYSLAESNFKTSNISKLTLLYADRDAAKRPYLV
jgi:hypothetical protein